MHIPFIKILQAIFFSMFFLFSFQTFASGEWIYYDDGEAVHAGSGMPYQGVRFSLPGDIVRAPLLQVSFYYSTNASSCPVTVYITDHSLSSMLLEPIVHDAVHGWNHIDLSLFDISVPHNFYVIIQNGSCGFPMLDDRQAGERSFKGNHVRSMTTRLYHALMIRAEIGEPLHIPVHSEWDMAVSDKVTVKQAGFPTRTIVNQTAGNWTLFAEQSFTEENGLYGILRQKGKKIQVSLDPEDVRTYVIEIISGHLTTQIADAVVTKMSFTGKSSDGTLKGSFKIFARIVFDDNNKPGKIIIERKFTGRTLMAPELIYFQKLDEK